MLKWSVMRWEIWSWKEGRRGAQVVIVFYFKTDFNENGLTLPRNIILKSE
jgi:hypothetical protein